MIIKEIKTWKFSELSQEIQEKILEENAFINVAAEWWLPMYNDAENVGLKITNFNTDQVAFVKADFMDSAEETALKILEEHGEKCTTYVTAADYLKKRGELVKKFSNGTQIDQVTEDNECEFDQELEDLNQKFLQDLCKDYQILLRQEYDDLTSEETVKETVVGLDFDYTAEGREI